MDREHFGQDNSYEELRQVVLSILSGREGPKVVSQYENLKNAVAMVLEAREGRQPQQPPIGGWQPGPELSRRDRDMLLEVFWGLFRDGIITLGIDDNNRNFPWFRLSGFGRRLIDNQQAYFFHDVSSYETVIKAEVSDIDAVTLVYLKEAMQDFKSGCLLSCSVMLGVATEHTFQELLETIEANGTLYPTFKNVYGERSVLRRLNKFQNILDQNQDILPASVKEDLDTNFMGIQSVIRNFRNESGHPTGKIIGREQCFVLLQLFVTYCKKMYELIDAFQQHRPKGREDCL